MQVRTDLGVPIAGRLSQRPLKQGTRDDFVRAKVSRWKFKMLTERLEPRHVAEIVGRLLCPDVPLIIRFGVNGED